MTIPKITLLGWFTREGRINNLWAKALADPIPDRSLERLRKVLKKLRKNPAAFSHLWLPFIDTFIHKGRVNALQEFDLKALEEMGAALSTFTKCSIRPDQVWLRVVEAYDTRKEERQARALLTRVCKNPYTPRSVKENCVRNLALRKARSDEHIDLYIEHLGRVTKRESETAVFNLLTDLCNVNFDSQQPSLKHAGEVAGRLEVKKIQVPGLNNVLGLYSLLIEKNPAKASPYFTSDFHEDSGNMSALIGLLASLIQCTDYSNVAKIAGTVGKIDDPVVEGLVRLSEVLQWLESREKPGPVPAAAETFANLNLDKYAGEAVHLAQGRLYLLEGNAKGASQILLPMVERYSHQPQIAYHAAWSALLIGDQDSVVHCFNLLNKWKWPGRWTVALMLMDIAPTLAERNNVQLHLEQVPRAFASILKTRAALGQMRTPPQIEWKPGSGTLEEDLEALRTVLGFSFYTKNEKVMKQHMDMPLFHRLPLADQMIWKGLYALVSGDQMQGRVLLEEAAVKLHYSRAALVLSVYLLEKNRTDEARQFLEQSAKGRREAKIELLRAYIDVLEGKTDTAAERLEKLLPQIEARAQYALGNLYLHRAEEERRKEQIKSISLYREQAAGAFFAALKVKDQSLPGESEIFAQCADMLAHPDKILSSQSLNWKEVEKLDAARVPPWITWNAVISQLWHGDSTEVVTAARKVIELIEQAVSIEEPVLIAIAQAVLMACINVRKLEEADELNKALEWLSTYNSNPGIKSLYRLGVTAGVRLRYSKNGWKEQNQQQQLKRLIKNDTENGSLTLLGAQVCLENGEKAEAVRIMQEVCHENKPDQSLCACLVHLLEGRLLSEESLPQLAKGAAPAMIQAYNLLLAAAAFSAGTTEKGYNNILAAMNNNTRDITSIVNFNKFLPALCAYSTRGRTVSPSLIEGIRKRTNTGAHNEENITIARCAAAIGETEYACLVWEKVLKESQENNDSIRQEFARYLCYLAIESFNENNNLEAAKKLSLAAQLNENR